jgi:AraC-like DNA-binding protein
MNSKYRHVTIRSSNLIVSRFEQVLELNYQDCDFDLAQMAQKMGISERQLQRNLRSLTGHTPSEYVRSYRLSKSLEFLLSGNSVRDTARAVGFSSQAYFASCFKAEYGRTPTEYRDRRTNLPE